MSCSPQVYVAIFLDPVIFHLTSAKSLQQIFWWKPMPLWVAGVIVAAIMVPLGQVSAGQVGGWGWGCGGGAVCKACVPSFGHRRGCSGHCAGQAAEMVCLVRGKCMWRQAGCRPPLQGVWCMRHTGCLSTSCTALKRVRHAAALQAVFTD